MTITINLVDKATGTINVPLHIQAVISSTNPIKGIQWLCDKQVNYTVDLNNTQLNFTPSINGEYTFTVTVTDTVESVSKVVKVTVGTVTPPPNPPPTPVCPAGQHWDASQNKCVPDTQPPPNPPPNPPPGPGTLIYNSDTDIDWSHDQKITDVYGTFKPNGKYFRMKASGSPRMYIVAATKELILEHDGKYGRAYFGVCNYQSRLELEFKLESCAHNCSLKTRNRHQYADIVSGAPDAQRQGGMGNAWHCDSVENDLEIVHGTGGEGGASKALSPKLEANKWYAVKFTQTDNNGKIHIKDEIDRGDGQGFKVANEGDVPAPSQFFNKAEFETWSEFWIRLNADSGGRLYLRNIKMYSL